jgi:hypothetical protein
MRTRSTPAALAALVGAASTVLAAQNTLLKFEVSTDAVNWSNLATVFPGQQVFARATMTYTGSNTVLGLGAGVYQPLVSNWTPQDTLLPFINGGLGGNTSGGALVGSQVTDTTSFGRVSPYARTNIMSTTQAIFGHYNVNPDGSGTNYLRIAGRQATSWFGGTGNTTGGAGVFSGQLNNVGRLPADPAFNPTLVDAYVFKFGMIIDEGSVARTMVVSTLASGMGNLNSATGDREVYWFRDMNENSGSDRGTAAIQIATINVIIPAPGSVGVLAAVGALIVRRRTRPVRPPGRGSAD